MVREKVCLKSKIYESSPTTHFGKFITMTIAQSAGGEMNGSEFNFGELDTGIQSRATILDPQPPQDFEMMPRFCLGHITDVK